MEFKKRLSFKNVFIGLYVLSFLIYLAIGFLPAKATYLASDSALIIPAINLDAEVVDSELRGGVFEVPEVQVGRFSRAKNKVFLFGHSTTVFSNLDKVNLRDKINYNGKVYHVIKREIVLKNNINMAKLLSQAEKGTIVVMTCAGELLENRDATHRLILTAIAE